MDDDFGDFQDAPVVYHRTPPETTIGTSNSSPVELKERPLSDQPMEELCGEACHDATEGPHDQDNGSRAEYSCGKGIAQPPVETGRAGEGSYVEVSREQVPTPAITTTTGRFVDGAGCVLADVLDVDVFAQFLHHTGQVVVRQTVESSGGSGAGSPASSSAAIEGSEGYAVRRVEEEKEGGPHYHHGSTETPSYSHNGSLASPSPSTVISPPKKHLVGRHHPHSLTRMRKALHIPLASSSTASPLSAPVEQDRSLFSPRDLVDQWAAQLATPQRVPRDLSVLVYDDALRHGGEAATTTVEALSDVLRAYDAQQKQQQQCCSSAELQTDDSGDDGSTCKREEGVVEAVETGSVEAVQRTMQRLARDAVGHASWAVHPLLRISLSSGGGV